LKAVEKRARDVKRMNEVGDELANKLDKYDGMSSEARRDQQTTNERYERIRLELQNREHLIEAQVNASDQFMTALQEFELDLTGVDAAILEEPAGSDSDTLNRQLAELQVFNKRSDTRMSVIIYLKIFIKPLAFYHKCRRLIGHATRYLFCCR